MCGRISCTVLLLCLFLVGSEVASEDEGSSGGGGRDTLDGSRSRSAFILNAGLVLMCSCILK